MGDKALRYLEALQAQHPGLAPCVGQLADLYQRKLWHQASSPAPKTHLMSCSDGDVELFALFHGRAGLQALLNEPVRQYNALIACLCLLSTAPD